MGVGRQQQPNFVCPDFELWTTFEETHTLHNLPLHDHKTLNLRFHLVQLI